MIKHDHHIDELFMRRAFALAILGRGAVSPNPLVGSVVVHDGRIIGEGWHERYGQAHAEVNAIHAVTDPALLKESIVYVNLEPCSHFGNTPPCADMLVERQVKKVVVANLDSNPRVAGAGIKKLRASGIEVITGILEKEGRELNKRFFTFMEKQRPYIILKWAETADGFIARLNHDSRWISNEFSRQIVHKWRAEEDAVLVGAKTVMHDNPQLNVRDWTGRNPVRIVIDRFLTLSEKLKFFDRTQHTLCYNLLKHEEFKNLHLVRIDEVGFLNNMMNDLYRKKIQSVIVEGGATLLNLFIEAGLWDEARVFQARRQFNKGIPAPKISGALTEMQDIEGDVLRILKPLPAHTAE